MKPNESPTAIVTGASSGIGLATALELAKKGFTVALVGRTRSALEAALIKVQAVGHGLVVPTDVSKAEEVQAMVQNVARSCGSIDVLINNAGMAPVTPLVQMSPERWHEVLNANLSSTFYATRAVWPIMSAQPHSELLEARGVIVNISSMASKDPFPGLGAYAVAKVGVNMLTLAAAREGHPVGIRVICIAPGAVETPMFQKVIGDQPINKEMVLQPADVARMILDAVSGSLRHSSGDTLFIHRRPS